MYAVYLEKYKMGELDDLYPIVFETKKQAKNYCKKVCYPFKVSSCSKVSLEWCNINKPYYYQIQPRREVKLLMWEYYSA